MFIFYQIMDTLLFTKYNSKIILYLEQATHLSNTIKQPMNGCYPLEMLMPLKKTHISTHSSGPVDSFTPYLSSSRGQLHGITTLSIMAKVHKVHHSSNAKIKATCDKQSAIKKLNTLTFDITERPTWTYILHNIQS